MADVGEPGLTDLPELIPQSRQQPTQFRWVDCSCAKLIGCLNLYDGIAVVILARLDLNVRQAEGLHRPFDFALDELLGSACDCQSFLHPLILLLCARPIRAPSRRNLEC